MNSVNSKIIVSVDMKQKDTMKIGGVVVSTALKYENNFREKSPVIAKVVSGNKHIKDDVVIICHHNNFYHPSPFYLYDNLFSIPFNKTIFAVLYPDGNINAVCGNVLGEKVMIETTFPLPPEQQKFYKDRIVITHEGWSKFKKGQLIFTRPSAPYDIVYFWNNEKRIVTKVSEDMICGVLD